jgi:alcohol dehydrogenase/S-(hydroxymethyl)glutathione dehydrogenase/alcohol dehydrogenase
VTHAAVMREIGSDLEVLEIDVLAPKSHEIVVKLAASGVCHSDATTLDGSLARMPCPMVLGHEGAGVVAEVGPDVTKFVPGDHVVLASAPKCGQCFWCLNGQPTLCEVIPLLIKGGLLDGTPRLLLNGEPLYQLSFTSTFSEVTVVPDIAATRISSDVSLVSASLLGCGVVTGYGSATRIADIQPGSSVAVIGCGGVGLSAIQGAKAKGAEQIFAVDVSPAKLKLAKTFGATDTALSAGGETIREVRAKTHHRGVDVAIDATGNIGAIGLMISMTRKGGECVFVGMPGGDDVLELQVQRSLVSAQKTFKGSVYGGVDIEVDVPHMLSEYQAGRLLLDELVGREIGLEDVNHALQTLHSSEFARSVIVF